MPGAMTITGMSAGLASGQKTIGPVTMTGTAEVGGITDANLSPGDNPFPVPPGPATAVSIYLGVSPAATVKVRTNLNGSDGGLAISPYTGTGWVAFPLPAGVTSLILNASTSVPGVELSFI